MTSIFSEFSLEWEGVTYTVPPDRMMGAIARVEDIVTIAEIHQQAARGGAFKLSRIAAAYAAILRYAGAPATVTQEAVYAGMFSKGTGQELIMSSVTGLLSMMIPPSDGGGAAPQGKQSGQSQETNSSLSEKPTS